MRASAVLLLQCCAAPKSWHVHEGRLAVTTDVLTGFTESGQIAALQGAGVSTVNLRGGTDALAIRRPTRCVY